MKSRLAALFFVLAWAAGVALRLSFPGDIEYKGDEHWMFVTTMRMIHLGDWPAVGMPSSVGLPNPGMSVWVFAALGWIGRVSNPIELARTVEVLNCVAITLVFLFAWRQSSETRPMWLWTAALAAVDPLGIILQRKIWAQSVLPLFVWLFFLAWRKRSHWLGALLWGAIGALLGQIHMSGFFYAAVFAGWSVYARRRQPVAWISWVIGSILGSLPMIPWIRFLIQNRPAIAHGGGVGPPLGGNVWRLWIEDAIGLNLDYSLGGTHLRELRQWPIALIATVASVIIAIALLLQLARTIWRERRGVLPALSSDGSVAHNLGFFVYGGLMNVLPMAFFRHYLLIVFPFESLSLPLIARITNVRTAWITALWVCHLALACAVLWFLHVNHGAQGADYGMGFQYQQLGR